MPLIKVFSTMFLSLPLGWEPRSSPAINMRIMNSLSMSAGKLFQFYKPLFFQELEMFSKLS